MEAYLLGRLRCRGETRQTKRENCPLCRKQRRVCWYRWRLTLTETCLLLSCTSCHFSTALPSRNPLPRPNTYPISRQCSRSTKNNSLAPRVICRPHTFIHAFPRIAHYRPLLHTKTSTRQAKRSLSWPCKRHQGCQMTVVGVDGDLSLYATRS